MNPSTSPIDFLFVLSLLYGLVILGVVIVILTALLRVQVGHSTSLREVFRQSRFLELTTVLVIIISGTYLAMSGKLTEGVVSLLSGIAGYVLGGLATGRQQQDLNAGSQASKPQQNSKVGTQSSSASVT